MKDRKFISERVSDTIISLSNMIIIPPDKLLNSEFSEIIHQIKLQVDNLDKIDVIANKKNKHHSSLNPIDLLQTLQGEYKEQVDECIKDVKELRTKTALSNLQSLDKRIKKDLVSKAIQASIYYFMALCKITLDQNNEYDEDFIRAYKLEPTHPIYLEKACFSYFKISDNKYEELKEHIYQIDEYNYVYWVIEVLEQENIFEFLKNDVPTLVLQKSNFQRLLYNSLAKKNYSEAIKYLKHIDLKALTEKLPETINQDNFHHWIFVFNILSNQYFNSIPEIPFKGFIEKNETNIYFLNLAKTLSSKIEKSEVSDGYYLIVFYTYWLESELDVKDNTIEKLKIAYNKTPQKDSFKTFLFANTLQKYEFKKEALELIDNYSTPLDENLILLKTFLIPNHTKESVREYFSIITKVDEVNVVNICVYITMISSLFKKEELNDYGLKVHRFIE